MILAQRRCHPHLLQPLVFQVVDARVLLLRTARMEVFGLRVVDVVRDN
jgi:hypothetical protein